jgi:hypothetical protein
MDIKLPNVSIIKSPASAPKDRGGESRKLPRLRGFSPISLGQRCPRRSPAQPGPLVREQGPSSRPLEPDFGPLGIPLSISEVARMIGCSPWSVRQTLIPQGLPHLRFKANGRLIFYQRQVARWIERQQEGGKTTK